MNLPQLPASLDVPCPDPGLTGDKGKDALRHRAALARCERRRGDTAAFYKDVRGRFSGKGTQ